MTGQPRRSGEGITRRQVLSGTAAAAGCLAVSGAQRLFAGRPVSAAAPRTLTPSRTPITSPSPRVVHTHCRQATDWDFDLEESWYGDHVSQFHVNRMVDQGLMALTGTASRAAAWQALIPGYVPGQRVAIKANVVNAQNQSDGDNDIDALVEVVNSVVAGLKELGVAEPDIAAGLFDAIASRVAALVGGIGQPQRFAFIGGGARIPAMRAALETKLGRDVRVPADPQFIVALGAALTAAAA